MSMRVLIEAIEGKGRLFDLLYTAEMQNLLSTENLERVRKSYSRGSAGAGAFHSDKDVYDLIGLRHYSIPMRFGRLDGMSVTDVRRHEDHLEHLIKEAGVRVQKFEPVDGETPDAIAKRIGALRDKADNAQEYSKHGQKLAKAADRREAADKRDATGGGYW